MRFVDQPYFAKPFSKEFRLARVAGVHVKAAYCSRCEGDREPINSTAELPRCTHCKKQHSSTSINCPVRKRVAADFHHMSEYHANSWTAKSAVFARSYITQSGELKELMTTILIQPVSSSVKRDGLKKLSVQPNQYQVVQVYQTTYFS